MRFEQGAERATGVLRGRRLRRGCKRQPMRGACGLCGRRGGGGDRSSTVGHVKSRWLTLPSSLFAVQGMAVCLVRGEGGARRRNRRLTGEGCSWMVVGSGRSRKCKVETVWVRAMRAWAAVSTGAGRGRQGVQQRGPSGATIIRIGCW